MSNKTVEDDFWNTSSSSTFNFDDDDDDDLSTQQILIRETKEVSTLPIHSVISNQGLNAILDDITSTVDHVSLSVDETIKKMLNGQKFIFYSMYQTLEDKLTLLDCGLETLDGNIIICIILFLRKTLKHNIFFTQLIKRKVAVKFYSNYLISKNNLEELGDLYMATGNFSSMKELYYLLSKNLTKTNQQVMLKKLKQFTIDHLPKLNSHEEKFDFYDNIHFIEWQTNKNVTKPISLIEQLADLIVTTKNDDELINLKKKFKIDDAQYDWTVMNVLAVKQMWDKLIQLFIKPNWLTKQNNFKSAIRIELFIIGLNKHKPPKSILEKFLQCFTDNEKSLLIAQKLNCYKFVIDYLILQKDRQGLIEYKQKIPVLCEEFVLIEKTLKMNDKKWKN